MLWSKLTPNRPSCRSAGACGEAPVAVLLLALFASGACGSGDAFEAAGEERGDAGAEAGGTGGAGGNVDAATGGSGGGADSGASGGSGADACVPTSSCLTLGYKCGSIDTGCGTELCGPPEVRVPDHDFGGPKTPTCPSGAPHLWSCIIAYNPVPGAPPFVDCQAFTDWGGSRGYCCTETQ